VDLSYLDGNVDEVWRRTIEHLQISLIALLISLPIALVLGALAVRYRQLQFPILTTLGVAYTIPSLVVLVFLIPSQGIGNRPILMTLVMYAQFFLVRNIVAGLRGVDPAALEAAHGVGMTGWQVFRIVWFPLALPVVIAGVRAALVTIIGLAVFGGLISAGGLGRILFEGIGRNYPSMVLSGILAIVALSFITDLALRLLEMATPVARARHASR
jgi:osmoprotectant transport system permease protein